MWLFSMRTVRERVFNFNKCLKCDNKSTLELKFIYIMDKDFRSVLQTRTNTQCDSSTTNKNKSLMADGTMALWCVMCDEEEGKKEPFTDNNPTTKNQNKNRQIPKNMNKTKQNRKQTDESKVFKFKRWTKGATNKTR